MVVYVEVNYIFNTWLILDKSTTNITPVSWIIRLSGPHIENRTRIKPTLHILENQLNMPTLLNMCVSVPYLMVSRYNTDIYMIKLCRKTPLNFPRITLIKYSNKSEWENTWANSWLHVLTELLNIYRLSFMFVYYEFITHAHSGCCLQ